MKSNEAEVTFYWNISRSLCEFDNDEAYSKFKEVIQIEVKYKSIK